VDEESLRFGERTPARLRSRRGAILPLVAVTVVGLLALAALAVDGGSLQRHRRLAQNAADAGAQAGASEIIRTFVDTATVFAAARADASRNGFTTGTNGVNVIVSTPASPDHFTGNQYVKVVVEDTVTSLFAGIIGRPKVVIKARAWGGIITPSTVCVAILSPSADPALLLETGADLTATNCEVAVNSSATGALDIGGGSVLTATAVDVTGTIDTSGGGVISSPSVEIHQPATPDPLAYVVTPNATTDPSYHTTCDFTNLHVTHTATLNPGTYCSNNSTDAALWIDGGSGDIITMNPGLYVMQGGGFRASHDGTINGTGVTIMNTNGSGNDPNDLGRINIETGVTVHLSAMTTGCLAGILFYLDRLAGNATTLALVNDFQTAGGSTLTGTLYFATQPVWFHTGASTVVTGGLVAKTARLSQSNTTVSFTGSGGGSGFATLKRPSIVE
jgi:type II secretory pathway pseudopilin PulG